MSNYKLNIQFREEDLPAIYKSQEKMIIVKPHSSSTSQPSIKWVVHDPFMRNTTSNWKTDFSVYSSIGEANTDTTCEKNTFTYEDSMNLSFTLDQCAAANEVSFDEHILQVNYIPYERTVDVSPMDCVDAFSNQDATNSATLNNETVNELVLPFDTSCTEITICYNAVTDKFEISESK